MTKDETVTKLMPGFTDLRDQDEWLAEFEERCRELFQKALADAEEASSREAPP